MPETASPKSEPGLVEGSTFTDISSGCGSNVGKTWGFSLFLTGRDTRPTSEIAGFKLTTLRTALTTSSNGGLSGFIAKAVQRSLVKTLDGAVRLFEAGNYAKAIGRLDSFVATVNANPGSFDDSSRNVSGELVARAESAIYIIGKLQTP